MTPRRVHPWLFMVLIIPYGAVSGYITVTLAYQLKQAGGSVGQIAGLIALGILPHTWKFFWAPVVDMTLNQKKWYLLAVLPSSLGLAAMGFFPATKPGLAALSAIAFLSSLATTVLGMSVESLTAHTTPPDMKGRAGGWLQAGSLGGSGIGGGLGLWLVGALPQAWMASCIVGGLCLLCAAALASVPAPERVANEHGLLGSFVAAFKDVWQVLRNRAGALAFMLCLLPIGSGAAPFAAIAGEWRASANTVALITGVLGGIISALGCLVGGWLCDRMDRKAGYVWFGIFQAASGVAMALLPHDQAMYIVWASVYTFSTGLTYAAFSSFVLEAIGKGAAATKYNALASLSNVPIYYMTRLDGWSNDRWGSNKMFFLESAIAVAAAGVFMLLAKALLRRRPTPPP